MYLLFAVKTQKLVESEAFSPSDTDFTIKFGFRVHFGALFGLYWRRGDIIFKICVTQTFTVSSFRKLCHRCHQILKID